MAKAQAVGVQIEGAFFIHHSLAHVNRQLAAGLDELGFLVSIKPHEPVPMETGSFEFQPELVRLARSKPKTLDIVIRHAFPPNLCPAEGTLILMQPWEFFAAPDEWVAFVNDHVTELWVNSNFTRAAYVRSGVDPRLVRVLPLGYQSFGVAQGDEPDPEIAKLPEFKFLYVGGSITRKGIDVLLQAFCDEFRPNDGVRLVIKDVGTQHVYSHNNWGNRIRELVASERAPAITYIDQDLEPAGLRALYRACDCLVAPYRAEGFCLPVLEAMGASLPVIVTSGGPTDDVVLHRCGWKIGSRPEPIEQTPGLESSMPQAWLAPDVMDLRATMREAFENRSGTKERGRTAYQVASSHFGWNHVLPLYAERVSAVAHMAQTGGVRQGKRPTISLCMIAKNEERVIEACLRSAKPFFDEIVFVDTGSTDRTMSIASKYVDKLLEFPWCDDFSAARNVSLDNASGDWVFWMDADDTLPPETGQAIKAAVRHASQDVAAFVIPVQFVEESAVHGTRVDHVKLFRNGPDVRFEGRIHEQILPSLRKRGGEIHRLNVVVLHSGYDTSAEGQAKKRTRDNKILALELKERPDHPFVLFNLGMTRHFEGRHKEAIKWLNKCLSKAEPTETIVRKAYALLAVSQRELGEPDKALKTVLKGLEVVPGDPELHFHAGQLLTVLGRYDESLGHYEEVPKADIGEHFSSIDMGILTYKTFHNMGSVCRMLGRFRQAKDWFLKAMDSAPEFLPSAFELFDSSLESGDMQTAALVLEQVKLRDGRTENWAKMVEKHAEASGGVEFATQTLRTLVKSDNMLLGPKLVLMRRLLALGLESEALPLMKELSDSRNAEATYLLGVERIRAGDFSKALVFMQSAQSLNPQHEQTRTQIQSLQSMIGHSEPG